MIAEGTPWLLLPAPGPSCSRWWCSPGAGPWRCRSSRRRGGPDRRVAPRPRLRARPPRPRCLRGGGGGGHRGAGQPRGRRARVAAHSGVMTSPPHPRPTALAALGVVLAVATGCGSGSSSPATASPATAAATTTVAGAPSGDPAPGVPALRVDTVVGGLEHPWDVGFLPDGAGLDGAVLVPERVGRLQLVRGGTATKVSMDLSDVLARGESGLMGLVVHPTSRRAASSPPANRTPRTAPRSTSASRPGPSPPTGAAPPRRPARS